MRCFGFGCFHAACSCVWLYKNVELTIHVMGQGGGEWLREMGGRAKGGKGRSKHRGERKKGAGTGNGKAAGSGVDASRFKCFL